VSLRARQSESELKWNNTGILFVFNFAGNGKEAHFEFLAGPGNPARKIRQEAEIDVKFQFLDYNTERLGI
jgi:hypothetical protein